MREYLYGVSLGIQLGTFILPPLLANSEQIADGAESVTPDPESCCGFSSQHNNGSW